MKEVIIFEDKYCKTCHSIYCKERDTGEKKERCISWFKHKCELLEERIRDLINDIEFISEQEDSQYINDILKKYKRRITCKRH